MVKNSSADAGDNKRCGSGGSPGAGKGNPLQYSCLEIPWTEDPDGPQSMGFQRVGHSCMSMRTMESFLGIEPKKVHLKEQNVQRNGSRSEYDVFGTNRSLW